MDAYVYRAALLCEDCAESVMGSLPHDTVDQGDSDCWPQGPYSDGGGEADCPQHCDHCHAFLENSLTHDGIRYVEEKIEAGEGNPAALAEWREFYQPDST